jgi:hypothetical protein
MHRAAAVSFALLLASTTLVAQAVSPTQPQAQIQTLSVAPPPSSCPISLHAQQSSAATRREVGSDDGRPKDIAQRLHITVAAPDSKRIVAANVTVRGFANKARLMQAMANQDSSDAAKTMDVPFVVGSGKQVSADLRVPGLTAVSAIDLNSVTYDDGSVWKLAAGSSCRSSIDGFMLVSSH